MPRGCLGTAGRRRNCVLDLAAGHGSFWLPPSCRVCVYIQYVCECFCKCVCVCVRYTCTLQCIVVSMETVFVCSVLQLLVYTVVTNTFQ